MKKRAHNGRIPRPTTIKEWVDLPAIYAVVNESSAEVFEAVEELKSSQYREVPMFPEQHAGIKPQIRREALQQLMDDGTLTLRAYIVTPRGEHTRRPIDLFCATHGITPPDTQHARAEALSR